VTCGPAAARHLDLLAFEPEFLDFLGYLMGPVDHHFVGLALVVHHLSLIEPIA